jgi:polyisoprenoid-binding protein YceI
MFRNLILASLALTLSYSASAKETTYDIDKDHSSVGFTVKHMLSNVKGNFTDFGGTIKMDDKNATKDEVFVHIKTASVDTRNSKRDEHLKSADFFDAAKMPEMTFKSTKITKKGKDKFNVEGMLSLHGVEKLVKLDGSYLGTAKDPWGGTRASFSATGKLNRKDFGLTWNKVLETGGVLVGEKIMLDLEIEATVAKADAPPKAEASSKETKLAKPSPAASPEVKK